MHKDATCSFIIKLEIYIQLMVYCVSNTNVNGKEVYRIEFARHL